MGDAAATANAMRVLMDTLNQEIASRSQIITPWKNIAYNASNFLADLGTWTVPADRVADFKYLKFGTMIVLSFHFNRTAPGLVATTMSNPAAAVAAVRIPELRAKLSARGSSDDASGYNGCYINDNTGPAAGVCYVTRKWNTFDEPAAVLNIEVASGRAYNTGGFGAAMFGVCVFEIEG